MSYHRAYYSIIQYCPDRGRAEAANVGVVVLCPDLGFVDAKTARGHTRIERFFGRGSFDAARLRLMKRAIEARIREKYDWTEGLSDLERFIATRANDLQLTPPRTLKTADPRTDLQSLFEELVGDGHKSKRTPAPDAFTRLREALRAPGVRERVKFNETLTIPVLGRDLKFPYAYQNGTRNFVKPEVFRGTEDKVLREAAELAVEGDLLQRHQAGRMIVVSAFADEAQEMSDRVTELFSEYRIRTVPEDKVDALAVEIASTAH